MIFSRVGDASAAAHPPAIGLITATSTSQPLGASESAKPVCDSSADAGSPACGVECGAPYASR